MWYIYGMLISMFAYYSINTFMDKMDDEVPVIGVLTYLFWPIGMPIFLFGLIKEELI